VPPLQRAPTSGSLALEKSSLERASLGRKRNFCQISAPPPENSGARWTPGTNRRKLLVWVGKIAAKNIRHAYHHCWVYSASKSVKNWKLEFFVNHLWHVDGRGGLPECIIFDACSILGVQFVSKIIPIIRCRGICARALYDRACLRLNNSKTGLPTPEIFTELVQTYVPYENLLWNPRRVASFLGRVPLKTQHSRKVNFFAQIFQGVKLSGGLNSRIPVKRLLWQLSVYARAELQEKTAKDKCRKTFFRSRLTHY